jgi:hypothetical protein
VPQHVIDDGPDAELQIVVERVGAGRGYVRVRRQLTLPTTSFPAKS